VKFCIHDPNVMPFSITSLVKIGTVKTTLYLRAHMKFCPYILHFLSEFDTIRHRKSTKSAVCEFRENHTEKAVFYRRA
jgi:hypothetical protein